MSDGGGGKDASKGAGGGGKSLGLMLLVVVTLMLVVAIWMRSNYTVQHSSLVVTDDEVFHDRDLWSSGEETDLQGRAKPPGAHKKRRWRSRSSVPGAILNAKPATPPSKLDLVLPYLTEGSFLLLLGLVLGIATRAILKVLFALALLGAVGLYYFEGQGIVTIDWARLADWSRNMVLNLPPNEDLGNVLLTKIPSLSGLGLGYIVGVKKG
jgi:uncharacterized membrane protein (Fun14 family)